MGDLPREMVILGELDKLPLKGEPLGENTFLVPFFNFFYYFLLVPFKITLDPVTNRYYLKAGLFNRILGALAHILVLLVFFYTTIVIVIFVARNEPAIVVAFELASNLAALMAYMIIMNLLWRRQSDLLQIIEWTRLEQHRRIRMGKIAVGYLIYALLFFLFACVSILNWSAINEDTSIFSAFNFRSPQINGTYLPNTSKKKEILSTVLLGLIMYTSTFYLTIQGILLVLTLALQQLGNEFEHQIEKYQSTAESVQSIERGILCYRELKKICEGIRRVYGNHLMAYYVSSVSYYAEAPHILLGRRGDTEKVVLIYFVVSGVVWIVAAEFHNHVKKTMLRWLRLHTDSKLISLEDRLKLLALSNEIVNDPIALSSKYFTVTYSHIGTMVGLVLTYGIIVCQLYHTF